MLKIKSRKKAKPTIPPVPPNRAQIAFDRVVVFYSEVLTDFQDCKITIEGVWSRFVIANRDPDLNFAFRCMLENPKSSEELRNMEKRWADMGLPSPFLETTKTLDIAKTEKAPVQRVD